MNQLVLERKEYLVGVTIYEARNVVGKDAAGTSDPFLKVRCADQVQQSQKKYESNSAVWNQSLTFNGLQMNQYELETFELILELYDHNPIRVNELIGQYSIGLSSLYRSLNHEFYKVWVGVFHPNDPNTVQGYLQISCFIVGPNERPPVHSMDEDIGEDVESEEEDEEAMAQKIENIKRAQGVMIVNSPNVVNKNYQLALVVMKAENLPNCLGSSVHPFVSARVNGCVLTSREVTKNPNPIFNNRLMFPITYPILNDKITLRIWSKNSGFTANTYIANIPEHPQENDFFNLSKLLSNDGRMPARWFNLYGTKPQERSPKTKSMREGTQYLGRVLIQMSVTPNEYPNLTIQNANAIKEPRQANFNLWVDLHQLINCGVAQPDTTIWAQVSIGANVSDFYRAKYKKATQSYMFINKKVETMELEYPSDLTQVPDIFINFFCNKGESPETRVGYIRLTAKEYTSKYPKPQWMRIKSPQVEVGAPSPGQILVNV